MRTDMTKLKVAFRNFAIAPKKEMVKRKASTAFPTWKLNLNYEVCRNIYDV
jgi:hypothetical protein